MYFELLTVIVNIKADPLIWSQVGASKYFRIFSYKNLEGGGGKLKLSLELWGRKKGEIQSKCMLSNILKYFGCPIFQRCCMCLQLHFGWCNWCQHIQYRISWKLPLPLPWLLTFVWCIPSLLGGQRGMLLLSGGGRTDRSSTRSTCVWTMTRERWKLLSSRDLIFFLS